MVDDPQHFTFAGATFARVMAHDGTGEVDAARVVERARGARGATFVDLVQIPPGCSIGVHTHDADEEIYVIVDGHGSMHVDGHLVRVGAGDVVVNRPHGTHGLQNVGDSPLRLVVIDVAPEGR